MELLWIPISIFAALMQAVRTAGQKRLNAVLSTWMTTYVRSLYGLPVLIAYLLLISRHDPTGPPPFSAAYLGWSLAAAAAQVAATVFLIMLFRLRNFAVGTILTKTDVMLAAIIGSLFFSEDISLWGWLAIALTIGGVGAISIGRIGAEKIAVGARLAALFARPTRIGLAAGLMFCFSYLFLREATLSLPAGGFLYRGAWTVVVVTAMQVVLVGAWVLATERAEFAKLPAQWKPCLFVGITSALGSIGWFTAMTIENASYVKSVGQVEVIFTLMISALYFRERITRLELIGVFVIVAGVLMFLL